MMHLYIILLWTALLCSTLGWYTFYTLGMPKPDAPPSPFILLADLGNYIVAAPLSDPNSPRLYQFTLPQLPEEEEGQRGQYQRGGAYEITGASEASHYIVPLPRKAQ